MVARIIDGERRRIKEVHDVTNNSRYRFAAVKQILFWIQQSMLKKTAQPSSCRLKKGTDFNIRNIKIF